MKKTLLILLLIFAIIFFSGLSLARSPTPTPESDIQSSYTMECLLPPDNVGIRSREIHGIQTQLMEAKPPTSITMTLSGQCSSSEGCDLTLCVTPNKRSLLTNPLWGGQGVPRGEVDHIGELCTTGNSKKDIYYFGLNYTIITTAKLTAPSLTDNHINPGTVTNLEVILNNPEPHVFYSFYAVGKTGGALLPTVTNGPFPTIADNNSQQIGMATGNSQQQTNLIAGETGKCQTIYWDPYGRVFDGSSLEPLNKDEARVTLLNKDKSIVAIPNNNVGIDILGKYNILIDKDGEYRLNVVPATYHQFVDFIPDQRYKDLYETIFMPSNPAFFESAKEPKRIDVALKPISTPYNRQIDVVQTDYKQVWANGKKYVKIEIRVTHPKSLVKLIVNDIVVKDNGEGQVLPTTADKDGYWKIMVRDYKVLSQNGFRLEISKNPAYYLNAGKPGDKIIIDFDPILAYIEGYAYDGKSVTIPNAKVQVKLKMNDSIFYETQTDDKGFFTINPANLPPLDFYFVFINPLNAQSIKKTTTNFVKDNNLYLEKEKIDLLKGEKNGQMVVRENQKLKEFTNDGKDQIFGNKNTKSNLITSKLKNTNLFVLGLIGLVILFVLIIFVYFIFFKNRNNNTP
ncbi:MAG: hypothetical protein WCT22_00500 [Patescibacteria group bacterium]